MLRTAWKPPELHVKGVGYKQSTAVVCFSSCKILIDLFTIINLKLLNKSLTLNTKLVTATKSPLIGAARKNNLRNVL